VNQDAVQQPGSCKALGGKKNANDLEMDRLARFAIGSEDTGASLLRPRGKLCVGRRVAGGSSPSETSDEEADGLEWGKVRRRNKNVNNGVRKCFKRLSRF